MRALAGSDILALWETARGYHPVDRALALLAAAEPTASHGELAALPLGQRDQHLIALRRLTFGDCLPGRTRCPHCNEAVEFELSCGTLLGASPNATLEQTLRVDGYELCLKPLNSYDLAAAAQAPDLNEAHRILLTRCVVEAWLDSLVIPVEDLPIEIAVPIAQTLADNDPQAELLVDLTCPACDHRWQSVLDIVHVLWNELAARAQRLLTEVHVLARAYGWPEADILALSPIRRAAYLERVMT